MELSRNIPLHKEIDTKYIMSVGLISLVALLIRLYVGDNIVGFMTDQGYFVSWIKSVSIYGIRDAYLNDNGLNYPPIFIFILMIYSKVLHALGYVATQGHISIKLPGIIIDQIAIYGFAWLNRYGLQDWKKIGLLLFFALNPAFIYDSAIWGQVDMLHGLLMALCLVWLTDRPRLAGCLFALAILSKFQTVMVAPVIGIYFLKQLISKEWKDSMRFIVGFAIPSMMIFTFFAVKGTFLIMIKQAYLSAYGLFIDVSMSAPNIWFYLVGTIPTTPDTTYILPGIMLRHVGLTFLFIALGFIMWCVYHSEHTRISILKAGAASVFAFYMLPTQMHDRYIIPVLIIVMVLQIYDRSWMKLSIGFTVTTFFTLLMVTKTGVNATNGSWIVYVNCIMFYLMLKDLWNYQNPNHA